MNEKSQVLTFKLIKCLGGAICAGLIVYLLGTSMHAYQFGIVDEVTGHVYQGIDAINYAFTPLTMTTIAALLVLAYVGISASTNKLSKLEKQSEQAETENETNSEQENK